MKLTLILLTLLLFSCTTTPDGSEVIQIDANTLDAIADDYAQWTLDNPTATFDEYKPQAIAQVLELTGIDPSEDPQAALIAWLDDTPVTGASLLTATAIVQGHPELYEYRVFIAQILSKLSDSAVT